MISAAVAGGAAISILCVADVMMEMLSNAADNRKCNYYINFGSTGNGYII